MISPLKVLVLTQETVAPLNGIYGMTIKTTFIKLVMAL